MEKAKKGKQKPSGTDIFTSALWIATRFGFFLKKPSSGNSKIKNN